MDPMAAGTISPEPAGAKEMAGPQAPLAWSTGTQQLPKDSASGTSGFPSSLRARFVPPGSVSTAAGFAPAAASDALTKDVTQPPKAPATASSQADKEHKGTFRSSQQSEAAGSTPCTDKQMRSVMAQGGSSLFMAWRKEQNLASLQLSRKCNQVGKQASQNSG